MALISRNFNTDKSKWFNPYLLFLLVSACVLMTYTQLETLDSKFSYWLLILSAIFFPLLSLKGLLNATKRQAGLVVLFLLISGVWFLLRGDLKVVMQLGLFTLGILWISSKNASLHISSLTLVYLLLVVIGIAVNFTTQISPYGLLPGNTAPDFGVWRVSFYPNIAYTGLLSLALVLVLTQTSRVAAQHPFVLIVAIYFLVFSIVRTAIIGVCVYMLLRWWFAKFGDRMGKMILFWATLTSAVILNIVIAYSPAIVVGLQNLPLISEIFLQGKAELSLEEIYNQIYRPWLWQQQISFFINSPYFMGLGTFEFADIVSVDSVSQIVSAGTESLLTRMLSIYGLPTILFLSFLLIQLKKHCNARDYWACACFPVVILLMMNWGSVFHPTDAMFLLFMMVLIRGRYAFPP